MPGRELKKLKPRKFRCTACKETKPSSQFYQDKSRSTGVSSRCKACSIKRLSKKKEAQQDIIKFISDLELEIDDDASLLDAVCLHVYGVRNATRGLSKEVRQKLADDGKLGRYFLLMKIAKLGVDSSLTTKEQKESLMWLGNKMFASPKQSLEIEQKVTVEKAISPEIENMITDLKVIDGGKE